MGIYKHYKGPLYQVLGLAHDANYPDRTCVIYIGLELDGAHLGPRLAVRTLEDFRSVVEDKELPETVLADGRRGNYEIRFRYLGPQLEQWML